MTLTGRLLIRLRAAFEALQTAFDGGTGCLVAVQKTSVDVGPFLVLGAAVDSLTHVAALGSATACKIVNERAHERGTRLAIALPSTSHQAVI
jgi:hypothetical protein